MTTSDFIAFAESEFGTAFPELVVRLIVDPDDDSTFFAYMFCVPDGCELDYKLRARELIRTKLKQYSDWRVIPSVKSMSITREHYPKYLKTPDPTEGVISNAAILKYMVFEQTVHVSHADLFEVIADTEYIGCSPCVVQPPQGNHESEFRFAA
jgi:hypothetical protein